MPVSDEGAALQFFVEAMKANTATLERVGKNLEGIQREQNETLKLVHDTRERVIRIESNRVNREVEKLSGEVEKLKEAELRRVGATTFASGMVRFGPAAFSILAILILVAVILVANGKLP